MNEYAFRAEEFTHRLVDQPVTRIEIAAKARQPEEDGYPISGDALALSRTVMLWRQRVTGVQP